MLKQMVWDGVQAVEKFGVDVGVVFVLFTSGVVLDVEELVFEVVCVSYAMVMIAGVPDFAWGLIAGGERVSAFDELDAFCC